MKCNQCDTKLIGKQKKYCSKLCKSRAHGNANYQLQQKRGLNRKLMFIEESGGCCQRCGYSKNLAALSFHHQDPSIKSFKLDSRNMSNRSVENLRKEVAKCLLLCANCHAEEHNPNLALNSFKPDALTN